MFPARPVHMRIAITTSASALLAATLSTSACVAHVTIPRAPGAEASAAARAAYVEQWGASTEEPLRVEVVRRAGARHPTTVVRSLALSSGVVVTAPEDLVPALPAGHALVHDAQRARQSRDDAALSGGFAIGVASLGVAAGAGILGAAFGVPDSPLLPPPSASTQQRQDAFSTVAIVSLSSVAAGFVGGGILMAPALAATAEAEDATSGVLRGYDAALRASLLPAPPAPATPSAPATTPVPAP